MSTIAERHPSATRAVDKRAFVAGGTATAALIAAAALVFVSLAAYVAFNGIPGGGGDDGADSVAVTSGSGLDGAPEAAARVLASAPAAVAAIPASSTPVASRPAGGGEGALGAGTAIGADSQGSPAVRGVGALPGDLGGQTPVTAPDRQSGALGGAVDQIERGTDPVIDTPLGDATDAVTGPLGPTIDEALGAVGEALGTPRRGD